MSTKRIVLAGSIDESSINNLKEISYQHGSFEFEGNCDFNRYNFNLDKFKHICNKGLHYIFCLESLNPRPVTLNEDIKILSSIFPKCVLKERLVILFVQKSDYDKSLNEIRDTIIDQFDVMYRYIGTTDYNERVEFAKNNIWLLQSDNGLDSLFKRLLDTEIYLTNFTDNNFSNDFSNNVFRSESPSLIISKKKSKHNQSESRTNTPVQSINNNLEYTPKQLVKYSNQQKYSETKKEYHLKQSNVTRSFLSRGFSQQQTSSVIFNFFEICDPCSKCGKYRVIRSSQMLRPKIGY